MFTGHFLLMIQMFQLFLDPNLVFLSKSLPLSLGQRELQSHIWSLTGLNGIV